jgi:general transcription factor 3C polypeptide 6
MSDSTLLCPGYKQVHEFDADEEYENEEVEYITLDLGHIEPTLIPASTEYCLIVSC